MRFSGKLGPHFGVTRWLPTLLLMAAVSSAKAAPPAQAPAKGQALFQQECAACHTIGGGTLVGPDLQGVARRRKRDWLIRWMVSPDKMLAEKDPIAVHLLQESNNISMPNLGLSKADAQLILAFLEHEGRESEAAQQPAQAPSAVSTGDSTLGRALFVGSIRFRNGAPACMSCHTVAGISALGGGVMGPDLTRVFNTYGAAGMASVLAALPFPTMKPVFNAHPLTPEEQVHLTAFLKTVAVRQPTHTTAQLGMLALLVFVGLMVVAQLIWRRRLQAVRRRLVGQA